MVTVTSQEQEEEILLSAEHEFYEKNGHSASLSEISKILKWSPSKVKEVRKRIENKGQGIAKKEKNKQILMLTGAGMGVIMAGIGAVAVVPSLRKTQKPTTPIIQPSGLPSQFAAQPPSQVVVIPERQTLRETYIERGGREYIQRDVSGGYPSGMPYYQQVETKDRCLELGWEWKDGVCHPPDTGDSQVGIGNEFCQMQMDLLKTGDQTALANANYTYQICGDFINPSEISNMIKAGCTVLGQYFEENILSCDPSRNPDGTPKTSERVDTRKTNCGGSGGTWNETSKLCRCPSGYVADLMSNCKKSAFTGESLPDRCTRLGGNWSGFTCMCPDGVSGQNIDCTTHGGREAPPPEEKDEEAEEWKCGNCPGLGHSDCADCPECFWDWINRQCKTRSVRITPPPEEEKETPTGIPSDFKNSSDCTNAGFRWNAVLGYCMR